MAILSSNGCNRVQMQRKQEQSCADLQGTKGASKDVKLNDDGTSIAAGHNIQALPGMPS